MKDMKHHKKGSFTDAHTDRAGKFEAAHEGTLFLDEIVTSNAVSTRLSVWSWIHSRSRARP